MSRRSEKQDTARQAELDKLAEEIAGLRAEVKALRLERDRTADVRKLEDKVEQLKREAATLTEAHEREKRDTEHEVGLLRKQQKQDAEHQTRQIELARQEAVLEVREKNLDHAQDQFDKNQAFREEQFAAQMAQGREQLTQIQDMFSGVLKRLPNIDVALSGAIGQPTPADGDDDPAPRRTRSRKPAD